MKRTVIDYVLRALKNALANWPLVIFRVIEFGVFAGITMFALVSTVVPVAVAAGLGKLTLRDVHATSEALTRFLIEHATLLGWLVVASTVALGVMLVIHSFIVAGSARIYCDAERATNDTSPLGAFDKFDVDTFWDAAWDGWWRVFAIYNLGGAAAGLIVLVPLIVAVLLMLAFPSLAIFIGILIAMVTCLLGIAVTIFGGLWILRAIAEANARDCEAQEALRVAWREVRAGFKMHFLAALLLAIISLGGIGFLEELTLIVFNSDWIASFVKIVAWALASGWWLAAFVGMAESRSSHP